MKKRVLGLMSFLLLLVLPITMIKADSYFSENGSSTEVNHSYFVAGDSVSSNDKVHGLNFVAGNTIEVKGESEYGFFAGNILNISGKVEKDLFAAGNFLTIDSLELGRDAYLAGNTIVLNSNVNGNAFIAASKVKLHNISINGDLSLSTANLVIEGNVNITGTLKVNDDVVIENESNLKVGNKEVYEIENIDISVNNIFTELIVSIATLMVLAFVINALLPKLYIKVNEDITANNTFKNLLFGLIGLVLIPLVSIIVLCSVVGLSLGAIILLGYFIMLLIANVLASMVVGNLVLTKLFKKEDNSYLSITIGILVIKILSIIPAIGGLISFLAFIYGFGRSIDLLKTMPRK